MVNDTGNQIAEGEFFVNEFHVDQVLKINNYLNLAVEYSNKLPAGVVRPPPISIHSYTAGAGQAKGVLTSRIENTDDTAKKVLYSHVIPWFLRVYYHTLAISCKETPIKPGKIMFYKRI